MERFIIMFTTAPCPLSLSQARLIQSTPSHQNPVCISIAFHMCQMFAHFILLDSYTWIKFCESESREAHLYALFYNLLSPS
jgi:hypothetical protein